MKRQGGQKTNVSGKLGECLALLYLQQRYPGTIIRFNHSQDRKDRPHDIEQYSRIPLLFDGIGSQETGMSPKCIWEVKSLVKCNKWFKIHPESHSRFMKQRSKKRYVFVLFHDAVQVKYFPEVTRVRHSIYELDAKRVSQLLRHTKYVGSEKKLSFRQIFPKELYTTKLKSNAEA